MRRRHRWYGDYYPRAKPRRHAEGIRAKTGKGKKFGQTWWAGKWLQALERLVDPNRLQRGRSYARSGQVLSIEFKGPEVEARVQGSRANPYVVNIQMTPLSKADWEKAVDVMASQAIYAAKLLSSEMPADIQELFQAADLSLFPDKPDDLKTSCSCPDWANPCKHASAVYYLLSEQFDSDPFLLFQLRGRSKEHVIADLRAKRIGAGRDAVEPEHIAESHEDETAEREEEIFTPLEDNPDHFWVAGDDFASIRFHIAAPLVDAVPVKRLGEPDFWVSKPDFIATASKAYRSITAAALDLALGE
ncbi:MAG TPA: SWIM zinc finger family protein [Blastocatellia bacterium]|nr:SWIM zinc finger family protein [Blastocatellia bacterium]